MTGAAKDDRVTVGAVGAGVLAVGCCAGIPLAVGAIAAIGGLAFGAIAAAVLFMVAAGVVLIRRRRHSCARSSPDGPAR